MFTDNQIPDQCIQLWDDCRTQVSILLSGLEPRAQGLRIPASTEIDCNQLDSVYLIREGIIREIIDKNILLNHEAGDLVGIDAILNKKPGILLTEFAIVVDEYDGKDLLNHVYQDAGRCQALTRFMTNLYHSFQWITCHQNLQLSDYNPKIRQYRKDDTIIEEGATDNEVYTLLTGSADAYVSETRVGEIKTDEIFGAITALTGTPRTARVVANSDCMVLVVPSEHFHDLLRTRPDTIKKLIEDMARTIAASNQRIVELSSQKHF